MRGSDGDGEYSCLVEYDAVWVWYIGAGFCRKALLEFLAYRPLGPTKFTAVERMNVNILETRLGRSVLTLIRFCRGDCTFQQQERH